MKEAKRVSESAAEQVQLVLSSHINGYKRLFGGQLMAWIDMLGGVIARRHAEHEVTTACIDNLQFKKACANSKVLMKGDRVMKTKKSLMYLECINENLNTLILNQEMTYFIMREILKKMDRSVNKRHVKVRRKKI